MTHAVLLLALALPADDAKKPAPLAKVTITSETACLHCTFGVGDSCALCLKLDEATPVVLDGKAAEPFFDKRLARTLLLVEGTLSMNKDNQIVLKVDKARPYTDKEKENAPKKGEVRIEGTVIREKAGLAIRNGKHPIFLDDKGAAEGKTITATGTLALDKDGKPRIEKKK